MSIHAPVRLDGDRDIANPPFWQLCEKHQILSLCPRPRPPLSNVMVIAALHAALALCFAIFGKRLDLALGTVALGVGVITVAYGIYHWAAVGKMPWLILDLGARRAELPHIGKTIGFDQVVELQQVSGWNPSPVSSLWITELNLVYRDDEGRLQVYPLVAAADEQALYDWCSHRLADAMAIPVRRHEVRTKKWWSKSTT